MRLWKMNGAGNAFAIFDARGRSFEPSPKQLQEIASIGGPEKLCKRVKIIVLYCWCWTVVQESDNKHELVTTEAPLEDRGLRQHRHRPPHSLYS